eukprot:791458-Alexandrium_andersonii.AAC.1
MAVLARAACIHAGATLDACAPHTWCICTLRCVHVGCFARCVLVQAAHMLHAVHTGRMAVAALDALVIPALTP